MKAGLADDAVAVMTAAIAAPSLVGIGVDAVDVVRFRRILARNGYQVITAASGPEALDIARNYQGEIHLLVTDVVMPHMLGKEVAEQVLLIKPGTEVLYMSGYARPVLASQGSTATTMHVTATKADGAKVEFDAVVRIDTPGEADYYRNGGILQYVLRNMLKAN